MQQIGNCQVCENKGVSVKTFSFPVSAYHMQSIRVCTSTVDCLTRWIDAYATEEELMRMQRVAVAEVTYTTKLLGRCTECQNMVSRYDTHLGKYKDGTEQYEHLDCFAQRLLKRLAERPL